MRIAIRLECVVCKSRNYSSSKNKQLQPQRVEYKKYCKTCKKHTLHKETR